MAARHRGTKRSLERKPEPNYTVYSYFPDQFETVLLGGEIQNEHPNVKCSACPATFKQKSILQYGGRDEYSGKNYIDLQFHQHGQLCLSCRRPDPGEAHFEDSHAFIEIEEKFLVELLTPVLDVEALHCIVWEYYKAEEHPEYTQLKTEHYDMLDNMVFTDDYTGRFVKSALLEIYGMVGRSYMSIPGVELVYTREKVDPSIELPDIKLDYRYWRPKECKCTKVPCECICFPAQVRNIKKVLEIPNTYKYKILGTLPYIDMVVNKHTFDRDDKLSFFVYLRSWTALNPDIDVDTAIGNGVCRTKRKGVGKFAAIVTVHTAECRRRNRQHRVYKCMLEDGRCDRCEDCLMGKYDY
jgi:hypothetical protein